MIVKCQRCGTEYVMPDIGVKPIMKDCPVCKQIDKTAKALLGDLYDSSVTTKKGEDAE